MLHQCTETCWWCPPANAEQLRAGEDVMGRSQAPAVACTASQPLDCLAAHWRCMLLMHACTAAMCGACMSAPLLKLLSMPRHVPAHKVYGLAPSQPCYKQDWQAVNEVATSCFED